jgi:hypothetical protein
MLKGALLVLLGASLGFVFQERERIYDRSVLLMVAQDTEAMRAANKALRNQCPARVRFQRGLLQFTPGGES